MAFNDHRSRSSRGVASPSLTLRSTNHRVAPPSWCFVGLVGGARGTSRGGSRHGEEMPRCPAEVPHPLEFPLPSPDPKSPAPPPPHDQHAPSPSTVKPSANRRHDR